MGLDAADEARIDRELADRASQIIDGEIMFRMMLPAAKEWAQREHWHLVPMIGAGGVIYYYKCHEVAPGDALATCAVVLNGGTAFEKPPGSA